MGLNSTLVAQVINFLILFLFVYLIVYLLFIRPRKWAQMNAQREDEITKKLDKIIELQEKQLQMSEKSSKIHNP